MRKRDLFLALGILDSDEAELRVDEYSCLCATVPGGELAIDLDDGRVLLRRDDGPVVEGLDAVRLVVEALRPPRYQHTMRDDGQGLRCVFCEQEIAACARSAECPAADPGRAVALGVGLYELGAEQPPPPESVAQRVRREQIERADRLTRTPRGAAGRASGNPCDEVELADVRPLFVGGVPAGIERIRYADVRPAGEPIGPYSNRFNAPPLNRENLQNVLDHMRGIVAEPSPIILPPGVGESLEIVRLYDVREGDRVAGHGGEVYDVERVGVVDPPDRMAIGVRGLGELVGAPDEEIAVAMPRRLLQQHLRSGDVVRLVDEGDDAREIAIAAIDRSGDVRIETPEGDVYAFGRDEHRVFELVRSLGWYAGARPLGPGDAYRVPLAERIPVDRAAPEVVALAEGQRVEAGQVVTESSFTRGPDGRGVVPRSVGEHVARTDDRDRQARDVELGDWVRFDPSPAAGTHVVVDVARQGGAAGTVSLWYADGRCETLTPQRRCAIISPNGDRIAAPEIVVGDVVRFSEPGAGDSGWVRVIEVRPRSQGRVQLRYRGPATVDGRATLAPGVEVLRRCVPRAEGIVYNCGTGTPPARP